jgi:hypothetical protein
MNPEIEPTLEESAEEIARVRAARHRISERFGHDPYRLVAYYMERQKEHADRLVQAPEQESLVGPASGDR